jgi:GNAT superfamily N-acetyltransferase
VSGPPESQSPDGESPGPDQVTLRRVGPGGTWASDSAFGVAVVTLWHRVAESGGAVGFAPTVSRAEVAAVVAGLVDDLRSGRAFGFALNRHRTLVGVGLLRPGRGLSRHTGEIVAVMVDPDLRGSGSGTRLMTALLAQAREAGVRKVEAVVRDGAGLEGFFGRFGFAEWGRRPGWIQLGSGHDRDEIILGADLNTVSTVSTAPVTTSTIGTAGTIESGTPR